MWGEIAYQLYGPDGYEYLKEYDQDRNAPGGNTLKGLFDLGDDPALILIDEIAAYLEAASAVEVGETTLASQTLSFVLSLLETASEVDGVTVVYSVADTAFAEEAEDVRTLVDELNQIGRRQHKTVTPTSEDEVGQVLQHRLFEEIDHTTAASISETYFQYYADSDRQFRRKQTMRVTSIVWNASIRSIRRSSIHSPRKSIPFRNSSVHGVRSSCWPVQSTISGIISPITTSDTGYGSMT